jgi:hydrogenase maturation protease
MRVFVGTVGYHFLRDYSVGPALLPELKAVSWAEGVEVDECNWGPVAVVQQFEAMTQPYERVVLLTASDYGAVPGTITVRHWLGGEAAPEELQGRINEAVTGVISVDNLLMIGEYFKVWPAQTFVVDVQPGVQEAGEAFTPEVEAVVPEVLAVVQRMAHADELDLPAMQDMRVSDLLVNQRHAFSSYSVR